MLSLRKYLNALVHRNNLINLKTSQLGIRIFKNFSIGVLGSILNILLSLTRPAILTKSLSLNGYGHLMIVINFYAFINIILDIKISDVLYRFIPDFNQLGSKRKVAGIIYLSLIVSVVMSMLTIVIVLCFSDWLSITLYKEEQIGYLLKAYLFAGAFTIIHGFSTSILRLNDKFHSVIVPQLIGGVITVIALIFYTIIGKGSSVQIIIVIIAFGNLIALLGPLYFALKLAKSYCENITIKDGVLSLQSHRYELQSLALQTNLASYLKLGAEAGSVFLLGVFGTPVQVALYNVAQQLTTPLNVLLQNITQALYPEIVRLYTSRQYSRIRSVINKVHSINAIIGAFILIGGYFLVKPVLLIFTSNEYLESIPVFLILLLTVYLSFISLSFYPLAVAMDQLKWRNIIVSLKLLFLGLLYFFGFNAFNVSIVQLIGSLLIRLFNDIPLYSKLRYKG